MHEIIAEIEIKTSVTFDTMKSENRTKTVSKARHELRFRAKMSVTEIGKLIGRNHATVSHSCNRHDAMKIK